MPSETSKTAETLPPRDETRAGTDAPGTSGPSPEARDAVATASPEVGSVVGHAKDVGDIEAGLDALQTAVAPTASRWSRAVQAVYPPVLAIAILLAVWQTLVWLEVQPIYNLPGPEQVWEAVTRAAASGTLWQALGTSLERGVLGFLAAVAIGTPLGILVARVRWVRVSFGPIITGLQVLPSVAWVPAGIIWFGLSDATVYFVILMGAVPSIINGIVSGVDQVPPLYRRVGQVLGAGRFQMIKDVILPAAFPGYLAGLKQGWAFSWRSLMAAEIIAVGGGIGFGLGAFLQQGRELSDMALVFTAILLILVVGMVIELLFFAPVEKSMLRRRGLAPETSTSKGSGWLLRRRELAAAAFGR
ncbi:ABC transporter permease [Oerskovia jenensis]|uniref:NitT/TauT family transport system permease protein n=1 Tax=Oerskovia jenensis TaxID=162169 RepID=A0ABS2LCR5_9CELL|nr:ABC transporter permease [Oerskovia jenensis]MBM7478226.1 NitT/TauT family transport system permease protein [Oerskovia jenensis]